MDITSVGTIDTVYSGVPFTGQDFHVCRITNTRVLLAYRDPVDTFVKVRCLEVAGDVVTHAGAVLPGNAFISNVDGVFRVTDTKAVVLYRREFNGYPTGLTIDIAGDGTLSISYTDVIQSVSATRMWGVRLSDSQCLISWLVASNSSLRTMVCGVGTGLGINTVSNIETSLGGASASFSALSSTQVLAVYQYTDITDGVLLKARVLDITGVTVNTGNTPTTVGLGSAEVPTGFPYFPFLANFGVGGDVGVFYVHKTSFLLVSRILRVTGSTVAASALTTHALAASQYGYAADLIPGTTDVMVVSQGATNTKAVILSGTSLTYGAITTVSVTANLETRACLVALTNQRTLYAYSLYVSGSVHERSARILRYNPPPVITVTTNLPMITGVMRGGGRVTGTLPMFTGRMSGRLQKSNTLSGDLPMITGLLRGGGAMSATLPMIVGVMTGKLTTSGRLEGDLPMFTGLMTGLVSSVGVLGGTLPMFIGGMRGGGALVGELPMIVGVMTGSRQATGVLVGVLPMFTGVMTGTSLTTGALIGILPMIVPSQFGRLVGALPMFVGVMSGGTVVAVTYEAYAVNLKPGEKMPNQVTRYTNYPFSQIVRHQNNYYGLYNGNLYLLAGTTDAGTAIPWTFKTAMTDDKVPEYKRVVAARFGGRVGAAATITLYTDEPTSNAYTYTTPRDATPQNYRQKFGQGVKGRYYALGAAGTVDLELDTLEPEVIKLTRRL